MHNQSNYEAWKDRDGSRSTFSFQSGELMPRRRYFLMTAHIFSPKRNYLVNRSRYTKAGIQLANSETIKPVILQGDMEDFKVFLCEVVK